MTQLLQDGCAQLVTLKRIVVTELRVRSIQLNQLSGPKPANSDWLKT